MTLTLPSAVAMGNGWCIRVQHAGSANQAILATVSSQLISEGSKSFSTGYALALNSEDIELRSDGGNWNVVSHLRLSSKSPRYHPDHGWAFSPAGLPAAWGALSAHRISVRRMVDILPARHRAVPRGSAAWVNFTPYTDCGWVAYVADENITYQFIDSAWVASTATTSFAGRVKLADQTAQEAGTATDQSVTPSTQQFHPSAESGGSRQRFAGGVRR